MRLERQVKINYHWENSEIVVPFIDTHIAEQLDREAMEHIRLMLAESYTSGELHTTINGVVFNGWWSFSYVQPDSFIEETT